MTNYENTKNEEQLIECKDNMINYESDENKCIKRIKKDKTKKQKLADITNIKNTNKDKIQKNSFVLNSNLNTMKKIEINTDIKKDEIENEKIEKGFENTGCKTEDRNENRIAIESIKNDKNTEVYCNIKDDVDVCDNLNENKSAIANKYFFDDLSDTVDNFSELENEKKNVLKEIEIKLGNKNKRRKKRKSCKSDIWLKKITKRNTKENNGYKNVRIIYSNRLFFNENANVEIKPGRRLKFAEYNEENMNKVENNLIERENCENLKKVKAKKKDVVVTKTLKKIIFANDFLYNARKK